MQALDRNLERVFSMGLWPSVVCAALVLGQAASGARFPQLAELVVKLDAGSLSEREAAEQAILALGPGVLAELPEAPPRSSAETRQRLARIRQTLLTSRAESVLNASQVPATESGIALSALFEAWQQQTGNRIWDYRSEFGQDNDDLTVDTALEARPFWPALDDLLDRLDLSVYSYSGEPAVAIVARGPRESDRLNRASYSGAFRVQALHFDAHRDLRDDGQTTLSLGLEMAWEPRLRPVAIVLDPIDLKGQDAEGRAIEAADAEAELEAMVNPGSVTAEIDVPLAPPPADCREIARLQGKFTVLLPGGIEEFRFQSLESARDARQRRGGVEVTLEQMRKNNDLWEARLLIAFDEASGALESHRGWIYDNEAFLLDAQGNQLANDGYQTTYESENGVGVAYLFDLPQGPGGYTLVYRTPAAILNSELSFELKDLPLP